MSYLQESLLENEKIAYISKPHWIIFIPSVAVLLLALLVLIYLPSLLLGNQPLLQGMSFNQLAALVITLFAILGFIRAYISYISTEYGVTNKRVIMKRGLVQRVSVEVFLNRIEGVNINQTITGRILNYGTVIIVGTGGTTDYYSSVPNPVQFRNLVQQQL